MPERRHNPPRTVTVIGGGVAGMTAACALAEAGYRVQLVERRGYLGGRASSYLHPGVNEVIDNCQHALFGAYTTSSPSIAASASKTKSTGPPNTP